MTEVQEIARRMASFDNWLAARRITLTSSQKVAATELICALLPMRQRGTGKSFLLETVEAFFDDVMRP